MAGRPHQFSSNFGDDMSTACPHCDSGDTIISAQDKHRLTTNGGATKRTRLCQSCHMQFRTVEVVATSLPNLVNDLGKIRQRRPGTPISSVRLPILGRINA